MLDTATKRVGFRRVELVQEALAKPDQYGTGTTFLFEVNGERIFMGGAYVVGVAPRCAHLKKFYARFELDTCGQFFDDGSAGKVQGVAAAS